MQPTWALALVGCFSLIAYGSLVPLEFTSLTLDEAWRRFLQVPFLDLGAASRADWIANGVLYAPAGFIAAHALAPVRGGGLARIAAAGAALGLCVALAVGVEFVQLWFPPRTVSQNDMLAETIGAALGVAAALALHGRVGAWSRLWRSGGSHLGAHLLEVYVLAYLALALFPYDLVLSAAELQAKWAGGVGTAWAPWMLEPRRGQGLDALMLGVEALIAAPLGALLARRLAARSVAWRVGGAALLGLGFGLLVEGAQMLLVSGTSQGVSLLTRALGAAAGAAALPLLAAAGPAGWRRSLQQWTPLWVPLWLLLLLWTNRLLPGLVSHWAGADAAAGTLQALRFVPFYYHYYLTEQQALTSLLSVALMYLPLAGLAWARGWSARNAALAAVVLVLAMEAGKLFVGGLRPDPSNVLIAVAAVALGRWLLGRAGVDASAGLSARAGARTEPRPAPAALSRGGPGRLPALALAGVPLALLGAWSFPLGAAPLVLAGTLALAWVWWQPVAVVGIAAMALTALDLAPWTGRYFWTEFDLLLLALLPVAWYRCRALGRTQPSPSPVLPLAPWLLLAFALLGLSLLVGAMLTALSAPTGLAGGLNAMSHLHSPLAGWRIVKGACWAAAFLGVWHALERAGHRPGPVAVAGMVLGLAFSLGWIVWERMAFATLLDFESDYRVTGPISAQHRGGAYIECSLAVGAAFALAAAVHGRWPLRVAMLGLLCGAGYAAAVTYSRNGHAALAVVLAVGLAVVGAAAWARRRDVGRGNAGGDAGGDPGTGAAAQATTAAVWRARLRPLAPAAVTLGAGLLVVATAWPVLSGPFARERLADVAADFEIRRLHWVDALSLRAPGWTSALLGEGVGRFPERHYWRSQELRRAASHSLVRDAAGKTALRLGPGASLYFDQILPREAAAPLRLSLDLRREGAPAELTVSVCEKWIFASLQCLTAVLRADVAAPAAGAAPGWQRLTADFDARALATQPWPARPLLKLSLHTPYDAPVVDVGQVGLRLLGAAGPVGPNLLANGDFSAGLDRWFWTTDVDPPWHIHSLPVAVLFDQGWLGVAAWAAVLALAAVGGWRRLRAGDTAVLAPLAAVAAFMTSGLLNTLIDEPRFLMLLLVLLWLVARPSRPSRPPWPVTPVTPVTPFMPGHPPGPPPAGAPPA